MSNDWTVKIICSSTFTGTMSGNTTKSAIRYSEIPLDLQISNNKIICPLCHTEVLIDFVSSRKYQIDECSLSLKKKINGALIHIIVGIILSLFFGYLSIAYDFKVIKEPLLDLIFLGGGILLSIAVVYIGMSRFFRYTYYSFKLSRKSISYNEDKFPSDVMHSLGSIKIVDKYHAFVHGKNNVGGRDCINYYGLPKKGLVEPVDLSW